MKPVTHKQITSIAIDHIHSEFPFTIEEVTELKLGVQKEDNPTLRRGANWHFYPANQTIAKKRWFGLHPTSLAVLKKREEQLKKHINSGDKKHIYRTLGRVLHHIQDMSTPTHVVPVYHSGGTKADPFEKYLVDSWCDISALLTTTDDTSQTSLSQNDFTQLYLNGGKRLLDSLADNNGLFPLKNLKTGKMISADKFWFEYGKGGEQFKVPFGIDGFGGFGEYGRRFDDKSLDELFSRKEVAAFYMSFALQDTIQALKFFKTTMHEE